MEQRGQFAEVLSQRHPNRFLQGIDPIRRSLEGFQFSISPGHEISSGADLHQTARQELRRLALIGLFQRFQNLKLSIDAVVG